MNGIQYCEITVERKAISSDPEYMVPDANFGTESVVWVPLSPLPGSPVVAERFPAEVQDVLPSRSEFVAQGLRVARKQIRVRLRWRGDITSDMRVTIHRDVDEVCQIIGGPAEIGERKSRIEIMCERFTSDP